MFVNVVKSESNSLDVFLIVDNTDISITTPNLYSFGENSNSRLFKNNEEYKFDSIHICEPIHNKCSTHEIVCVLTKVDNENKKIFICLPIKNIPNRKLIKDLEIILESTEINIAYKTKTNNLVIVNNDNLEMTLESDVNQVLAKTIYKNVIEFDIYDVMNNLMVNSEKNVEGLYNVIFSKKLIDNPKIQEGFLAGDGTYMECKLLQEDPTDINDVFEDVAVVPLQTNSYERGIVTFSHFLHMFLVTVVAGIGLPQLFATVFKREDFISIKDGTEQPNNLRNIIGYGSFVLFFISGLIIMTIGLSDPRFRRVRSNEMLIPGSVMSVVGFYFILIHCSFALGMLFVKKFSSDLFPKFAVLFVDQNLGFSSFFDVMTGFKVKTDL